ncbi:MAG: ATP-binding protein [Verrucomicrobiota bacterium]|nr:ATP-binding protein [Verrucomicrobiota bacterium]
MKKYIRRLLSPPKESFFLLGPRGTGKSTWLQHAYPEAVRIDLLVPEQERKYLAAPERLRELVDSLPKGGTLILDEIQRAPGLLPVVHSLIEGGKEVQFIMTGSSARKLRREVGNLLGGRALLRVMPPFFAAELGEEFDFTTTLKVGLLPMVREAKNPWEKVLNYVGVYLREEVIAEGFVRQVGDFARFLEVCSFSHGNVLNINNIAREAQVKRTTVDNYLQILEDLLIAFQLPVFTRKAQRALISHPKFYYFDVGVFRSLRPQGPMDREAELEGPALEGLIAQHLRAWVQLQREPHQFCFWRTRSDLEVDFIIYGPKGFWAIEVKRGKDVHSADLKGLRAFREEYNQAMPLLLYLGKERLQIDGITCLPLEPFLLQLRPDQAFL